MTPQTKGGWCKVTIWSRRLTNAFMRLMLRSALNARNRRLRYKACFEELMRRGSRSDSYKVR